MFLNFFQIKGKKATDIAYKILQQLEMDVLNINDCRAQWYDDSITASDIYGHVQALIKNMNEQALFSGGLSYSLNLCEEHSSAQNTACVNFFNTLSSYKNIPAFYWIVLAKQNGLLTMTLSNRLVCYLISV